MTPTVIYLPKERIVKCTCCGRHDNYEPDATHDNSYNKVAYFSENYIHSVAASLGMDANALIAKLHGK